MDFALPLIIASVLAVSPDITADGVVDGADLGLLFGAWGTPDADFNDDGVTDSADMGILLGLWGRFPARNDGLGGDRQWYAVDPASAQTVSDSLTRYRFTSDDGSRWGWVYQTREEQDGQ